MEENLNEKILKGDEISNQMVQCCYEIFTVEKYFFLLTISVMIHVVTLTIMTLT